MVEVSHPYKNDSHHDYLVDFDSGALWDSSSFPNCLPQSTKGAASLGEAAVDFSIINLSRARECVAKVGEMLQGLQSLSLHCDVRFLNWVSWRWLVQNFYLLGVDGKTIVVGETHPSPAVSPVLWRH